MNEPIAESHAIRATKRRPTAISQALSQLKASIDNADRGMPAGSGLGSESGMRLRVATERRDREQAYRLAYAVYRRKGYVAPSERKWLVTADDARPDTLTLLVEAPGGEAAGTITLVYDGKGGLPSDRVFGAELDGLRAGGRRPVEVTRLAIGEGYQREREVLVRMFNAIYLHATRVRRFSDFVIEVNPRHAGFYRRLLLFEQISQSRSCPRVRGAPAVLMRLDLAVACRETIQWAGQREEALTRRVRTLYPYFLPPDAARDLIDRLRAGQRAMDVRDAAYFGCGT